MTLLRACRCSDWQLLSRPAARRCPSLSRRSSCTDLLLHVVHGLSALSAFRGARHGVVENSTTRKGGRTVRGASRRRGGGAADGEEETERRKKKEKKKRNSQSQATSRSECGSEISRRAASGRSAREERKARGREGRSATAAADASESGRVGRSTSNRPRPCTLLP